MKSDAGPGLRVARERARGLGYHLKNRPAREDHEPLLSKTRRKRKLQKTISPLSRKFHLHTEGCGRAVADRSIQ
jgi:hypothetical protein